MSDCASDVAVAGFLNKVGCPVRPRSATARVNYTLMLTCTGFSDRRDLGRLVPANTSKILRLCCVEGNQLLQSLSIVPYYNALLQIALERFQLDKRSTVRLPPLPS